MWWENVSLIWSLAGVVCEAEPCQPAASKLLWMQNSRKLQERYSERLNHLGHPFSLVPGSFALKTHKHSKVTYISGLAQICVVHLTAKGDFFLFHVWAGKLYITCLVICVCRLMVQLSLVCEMLVHGTGGWLQTTGSSRVPALCIPLRLPERLWSTQSHV